MRELASLQSPNKVYYKDLFCEKKLLYLIYLDIFANVFSKKGLQGLIGGNCWHIASIQSPSLPPESSIVFEKRGMGSQSNKESLFDSEKRQITTYSLNFVMVKLFIRSTNLTGAEGVAKEM